MTYATVWNKNYCRK